MKFSLRNLKNNSLLNNAGVFAGRPFVFCACISILILGICLLSNIYFRIISAVLSLMAGIFFLTFKRSYSKFGTYTRIIYIIGAIMCLLLSFRTVYHFDIKGASCEKYVSESAEITAYAIPNKSKYIKITNINGEDVSYYAVLYGAYTPDPYEEFTCIGKLNTVKSNSFSGSTYHIGNNISFTLKADEIHKSGKLSKTPHAEFYKINTYIRSSLYEHCDENAGLISGIFLGNKADIPSTVKSDFSKTGISHIITVSGLHVIAALSLLSFILDKSVPLKSLRALILIFAALFYALITGCMYSVMRAALMYIILNSSVVLFRKNDSLTSLFISLYIILLFKPYALFDVSLQLSAISTFGIVVFAAPLCKRIDEMRKKNGSFSKYLLRASAKSLIISLCATLPLVPISAYYFGKISLASPIMTLIISPFVLIILYAAPFTVIFSFSDALADLAGQLCDSCAEISAFLASSGAHYLNFEVSLKYAFSSVIIFAACAVTIILIFFGARKKRVYAGLCAVLASVYFISVGMYHFTSKNTDDMIYSCVTDDVLCRINDNRAVAVDITDGSESSYILLFNELYERGILNIDTLILTRCGIDHPKLIKNLHADYGIKNLILPEKDQYTMHVSVAAETLKIPYTFYDAETGFSSKSEKLEISPSYYLGEPRGCTINWNGALYTSGRTLDVDTYSTIPVFIYGTFSDISETAVIPVKNTELALVPKEIKEELFFIPEFEEYQKCVNVKIFNSITTVDMRKYSE